MAEPSTPRSATLCIRLGTAGLLLAAFGAIAAPDAPQDALQRLLADKGLLAPAPLATPSTQGSLARKMRDGASEMVLTAMNFLGVPYLRGGSNESGFDCSGFTRHVFELSLGLVLPRRSDEQARAAGLLPIKRDELKPGDLVFFNTLKRTFSHVGIYIGDDKFIHSPRTGAEVRVENMQLAYWTKRYNGARRAETIAVHTPATPAQGAAAAAFNHEQWGSTPQAASR
ncbi:MAG: C40 family peptidase [Rhizobacter sp.]|nr:C40 family peptidase [Rhizobacter sp.]